MLAVVPQRGVELRRWIFGRGLDTIGGKDHGEGAVHHHLEDFVEGDQAVVDHRAVAKFLYSLNKCWIQISMAYTNFVGRSPSAVSHPLKKIFLVLIAAAIDFTPETSVLLEPNKIKVLPE